MIRRLGIIFIFILFSTSMYGQYTNLQIESEEAYLKRQIELAKMKQQLDDIKNGRPVTDYGNQNTGARSTFTAEIHECSNNGYHNTGYEHYCFDMYFYPDGSVLWDRRRFNQVKYNDRLSGTYYLVESYTNAYDLYITWANGAKSKGYVEYNGTRAKIHIDGFVFNAK